MHRFFSHVAICCCSRRALKADRGCVTSGVGVARAGIAVSRRTTHTGISSGVARARRSAKAALSPALDMPVTPATLDDIPLLTDAVEDFDTPSIPHPHIIEDESSAWNDAVDEDPSVAARGPDSLAQLPELVPSAPTEPADETSLAEIKGFTPIPDVGELIGTPDTAPAPVASHSLPRGCYPVRGCLLSRSIRPWRQF